MQVQTTASQFDSSAALVAGLPIPPSQSMEVGESVKLKPKFEISRDATRYVVQAGDLLPDATKRNWKGLQGYQIGGMHFDLTEIPCLWKFSGFITRGRITPLIKKPVIAFQAEGIVKKKAEQVAEILDRGGIVTESTEVRRMAYPWDSLRSLLAEHNVRKGIVEITALEGVEWDLRIAQELQLYFFPNWAEIEAGRAAIPFTVREFIAHIESRLGGSHDTAIQAVGAAYLESASRFKVYAEEVVQKTKDLAQRGALESGYVMTVSALARHLAAQVEMSVEAKQTVVFQGAGTAASAGVSDAEIALRNREMAIEEEKLRIERIKLGIEAVGVNGSGSVKAVQPVTARAGQSMENDDAGIAAGDNTAEAAALNQFADDAPQAAGTKETAEAAEAPVPNAKNAKKK